nr:unnamed protein product [Digitaria exilis]
MPPWPGNPYEKPSGMATEEAGAAVSSAWTRVLRSWTWPPRSLIAWRRSCMVGSGQASFLLSSSPGIPDTKLVGFLALPGISRREYECAGGGGGERRRRWCAVIAGKVEAVAL